MGLAARPGRARPDRPQRPRDPARHRTPNAAPDRNRRLGIGVGDGGFPARGAGCAVSLCRRRVDVLTEPTGGPFSRGRRGPFFSCHFQAHRGTQALSRRRLPPEPSPTAAAATATRRAPEVQPAAPRNTGVAGRADERRVPASWSPGLPKRPARKRKGSARTGAICWRSLGWLRRPGADGAAATALRPRPRRTNGVEAPPLEGDQDEPPGPPRRTPPPRPRTGGRR